LASCAPTKTHTLRANGLVWFRRDRVKVVWEQVWEQV
jgi:hypothetical protein